MRLGFVTFVLLMATAIFACGGDELPAVSDPPTQPQQATEAPAQQEDEERPSSGQRTRPPEAGRSAESGTDAETGVVETEPPPEDSSGDETAIQEPEREAGETSDAAHEAEAEDAEPEPEEEPEDLTDVAAVVMKDADIRVRPGLSWSVIGRLNAGEEVSVLSAAEGWFRISFGDDREGWIRMPALDLGEVNPWWILKEPAPAIVAEWQGEQYCVMGQSADGAEVRLLPREDGLAQIVSAPIDEVNLLADDITVHDLPILIGDETVVFPGDDFRVGQGRILPKGNEWMWLPWGWLLAHNDSHIWQWRPETDELEFVRRPPGEASLSPDGRNLAILTCGGVESCFPIEDVTLMPLDGAATITLRGQLSKAGRLDELRAIQLSSAYDLSWSRSGAALLVPIRAEGAGIPGSSAVLFDANGAMTLFEWEPQGVLTDKICIPIRYPYRSRQELWVYWGFNSHTSVRIRVDCRDDDEPAAFWAAYSNGGEFLRLEPEPESAGPDSDEVVQTATGADQLGEAYQVLMNGTIRHSIIVAPEPRKLFIYDWGEHRLRPTTDTSKGIPEWIWELLELGPSVGYLGWDLYWVAERYVAVISRSGNHVAGGLLIDLAAGAAVALEIGAIRTWPCYPTGEWRPDSSIFQVEFEGFSSYEQLDRFWIDATATPRGVIAQRQFVRSDGEAIAVLRAVAHLQFSTPSHLAGWSRNGDWLAIGGHQNLHHCYGGA